MKPKLTVAIVHNADYGEMDSLLKLSPSLVLLTLSPHVAKSLAKGTGREADWMLPVYPVRPDPDCTASEGSQERDPPCLRGFAMQASESLPLLVCDFRTCCSASSTGVSFPCPWFCPLQMLLLLAPEPARLVPPARVPRGSLSGAVPWLR